MKEHYIPIQLSQYSNYIIGSSLSYLKINFLIQKKINNNSNFSLQINFSDTRLENFPTKGLLNIYITKNKFFESEVVYENKELLNAPSKLILGGETHLVSYTDEYEFCPLKDRYNSSFYYNTFVDTLTENESHIFNISDEFNSKNSKIGGYQSGNKTTFDIQSFDFDNPWILLAQINTEEILENQQPCLLKWFIKKQSLINCDFSEVIFETEFFTLL